MGKDSGISWTHHTFNPWWGCEKVSPACTHCYAERDAKRYGQRVWGKDAPRRQLSDGYWMQPHKWDVEAKQKGVRFRVFCASMADVFEDREDLRPLRERLWNLIQDTSGLDWLLLTKRPENIRRMLPPTWLKEPRQNVWLGTTAETQDYANHRILELLHVPAVLHFVSMEPLLGPVDLGAFLPGDRWWTADPPMEKPLDWVILGGESGPQIRPLQEWWLHSLVNQCQAAGTAVFVKQLGRVVLTGRTAKVGNVSASPAMRLADPKGADPREWPIELNVREFPANPRGRS